MFSCSICEIVNDQNLTVATGMMHSGLPWWCFGMINVVVCPCLSHFMIFPNWFQNMLTGLMAWLLWELGKQWTGVTFWMPSEREDERKMCWKSRFCICNLEQATRGQVKRPETRALCRQPGQTSKPTESGCPLSLHAEGYSEQEIWVHMVCCFNVQWEWSFN